MKKGLSTNKSMSAFYGRVINAVESKDLIAIVDVCAGKLSLPLLYRIAGCGDATIPFEIVQAAIDAGAEIATSEIAFNNAFYASMCKQLALGFCHALHEEYADKKFDTFVNLDDLDVPNAITILYHKGAGIADIERESFDFGYGMAGKVAAWLSER